MEPKKVVKEMGKQQLIPVVGLPPLVTILSLGIAIMLALLYSWIASLVLFTTVVFCGRWVFNTDPKFIDLLFLSLTTGTEYDPALQEDMDDYPSTD